MKVEVAYGRKDQQFLISLALEAGATVADAIHKSGILAECSEINLNTYKVGIFSKTTDLTAVLQEQDRVEIYRPLQVDPKQARKLRAERVKKVQNK
jgi:putative ubiquitin-RnfH superfamily antitoxin RatB of RatAB toxin-antitoxin module